MSEYQRLLAQLLEVETIELELRNEHALTTQTERVLNNEKFRINAAMNTIYPFSSSR